MLGMAVIVHAEAVKSDKGESLAEPLIFLAGVVNILDAFGAITRQQQADKADFLTLAAAMSHQVATIVPCNASAHGPNKVWARYSPAKAILTQSQGGNSMLGIFIHYILAIKTQNPTNI